MKLLIDGRPLCRRMAGTAMFLKLAIDNILRYWNGVKLIIICPAKLPEDLKTAWGKEVEIIEDCNSFLAKKSFFAWYMLKMPVFLKRYQPDIFWTPSPSLPYFMPSTVKSLVIVHDVVNKEFAKTMSWKNRVQAEMVFDYSVRKADYIWTNSMYTKSSLLKYYPNLVQKSIFTGLSIDTSCFHVLAVTDVEKKAIKIKYNIGEQGYILFVGTLEPRKNLKFLLSLMPDIYTKSGMKLLVVGAKGWKCNNDISNMMNLPGMKEAITFTGYVENEELALLYNLAKSYVSTSLNEGFGMPQLEALYCGCPVVCPNNSAMKEVVGALGHTIEGWNRMVWIDEIIKTASEPNKNVQVPQKYDWEFIINSLYDFILKNK